MAITEAEPCKSGKPALRCSFTLMLLLQLLLPDKLHHWHLFEQFNIGIIWETQLVCLPRPSSWPHLLTIRFE
jgi:hypothetical protein